MAKTSSSLVNMLVVLTAVTVIASGALAYVYDLTKGPIEVASKQKVLDAIGSVAPKFDNQPDQEAYEVTDSEGGVIKIYPAKLAGQKVGAAIESYTKKGFSGEIKVMVGMDASGVITGYTVLQHAETPGLGSKMEEWFRAQKNKQNIIGLSAQDPITVSKDGGEVDAITAATISSRAFLDAINRAYSAYQQVDNASGATASAADTTATNNPQN